MNAQNWVIAVSDPAGAISPTYYTYQDTTGITVYPDGASGSPTSVTTVSLRAKLITDLRYSVDGNGDSIEATWMGDSLDGLLSINPLDKIQIFTLGYLPGENASYYYPRWLGFATLPTNLNHDDGLKHQYRAVGMREALYGVDTTNNTQYDAGSDVSVYVEALIYKCISDSTMRYGLTAHEVGGSMPNVGLVATGAINPNSDSLGANLDALAEYASQSGALIDWWVSAAGEIHFQERDATTTKIYQADGDSVVEWTGVQSEQLVTRVRHILATANIDRGFMNSGSSVPAETPDTLTHLSDSGVTTWGSSTKPDQVPDSASWLIPVPGTTLITTGTLVDSYVGVTADTTATLSRTRDGNGTSFAVIEANASGVIQLTYGVSGTYLEKNIVGLSVKLRQAQSSTDITDNDVLVTIADASASTSGYHLLSGKWQGADGGTVSYDQAQGSPNIEVFLIAGDRSRSSSTGSFGGASLRVDLSPVNTRIALEDFRIWAVDPTALDNRAERLYAFPETDACRVTIDGQSGPTGRMDLHLADGTTKTALEVTTWETRITGEGATLTTATIGPREAPTQTSAARRINARITSAAVAAMRARR